MIEIVTAKLQIEVDKDEEGNITIVDIWASIGPWPGRKIVDIGGMSHPVDGKIEDLFLSEMGDELRKEYEKALADELASNAFLDSQYGDR